MGAGVTGEGREIKDLPPGLGVGMSCWTSVRAAATELSSVHRRERGGYSSPIRIFLLLCEPPWKEQEKLNKSSGISMSDLKKFCVTGFCVITQIGGLGDLESGEEFSPISELCVVWWSCRPSESRK